MTTDLADNDVQEPAAPTPPATDHGPSGLVRAHLVIASVFLVVATLLLTAASIELAVPGAYSGIVLFSYGRLVPIATAALLYGWLTIGLIGAIYYILPRLTSGPLRHEGAAFVALILVTLGVATGMGSIYLGASEGRAYQEMPLWSDVLLLAGFALVAWVATTTVAHRRDRLGPAEWYLVAATWWLVLISVVGMLPGIGGYAGEIQSSFYRAGLTGLWFAAAGVGVVYYLIPRLAGADPIQPSAISVLGFWSLAFVWAATGPRDLIYGAGPDWLETLGVAASIALVVPVAVIVTDFVLEMRGRWLQIPDRVTLRFLVAGGAMLAIVPLADIVATTRTSSAVVQFTGWVAANDALMFLGAASMWLFAFAYHVLGTGTSPAREQAAIWHYRYTVVGLSLLLVAVWLGATLAGFTWASGANSGLFVDTGEGFFNTAARLKPYFGVAAIGMAVYALAQGLFVVGAFSPAARTGPELPVIDAEPIDLEIEGGVSTVRWGQLRWGAVSLFLIVGTMMWFLPSLDPANASSTILADESRIYPAGSAEARGREVYVREGCAVCHTQEVRAVVPDVGLGPVSVAGDYVHEDPIQRGYRRLGPDLMHVGSRAESNTYEFLFAHLADPRVERPWSFMPSYSYLSDADLDALAVYLTSLK